MDRGASMPMRTEPPTSSMTWTTMSSPTMTRSPGLRVMMSMFSGSSLDSGSHGPFATKIGARTLVLKADSSAPARTVTRTLAAASPTWRGNPSHRLTDGHVGHAAPVNRARHGLVSFWRKAYEDNLTGLAAMVAYNLLLSVFPLALVALFVAGRLVRSAELQLSVLADLQKVFPSAAESTLTAGVRRLEQTSTTVGIIAVATSAWVAASFWGALDTAFCRIYHRPCRTWVRQKLFALGMLVVVLLFFGATVTVPTLQGLVANASRDLPLGLDRVSGIVGAISLAGGLLLLFAVLCLTYWRVPKGAIPRRCIWPGALGAMVAMAVVDYAFPLYLSHVSTLRVGSTLVFVLIVLIWFYALAIILLSGAVVNELRFEHRDAAR